MSKKTQEIYQSINNLNSLQRDLIEYNETLQDRKLQDIEFQMGQELKKLKFWIDSLYSLNGKSTSIAKKNASKENGKKGGRPPKAVTEANRLIRELENEIPEIEHKLDLTDLPDEREALEKELEEKRNHLSDLKSGLSIYMLSR
ncbi:MAG: hypothetical protein K6C97_02370 [Treponema sp.]|nr:hypothetical protein [Treponema sp.]